MDFGCWGTLAREPNLMASGRQRRYTALDRGGPTPEAIDTTAKTLPCSNPNESDKAVSMSGFKEPSLADRQKASREARLNLLNKFRSQPGQDDPAVKQRQAEREASAADRAKAKLARDAAKVEQKKREAEAAADAAAKLVRDKEAAAA